MINWRHSDKRLTDYLLKLGASQYAWWNFWAVYGLLGFLLVAIGAQILGLLKSGVAFFISGALAYLGVLLLQLVIKRERPKFEQLTGYRMWWRTYSCPSGHAGVAASLATILFLLNTWPSFGMLWLGGIILSSLAFLIGLSRVMVGVHYVGDVLFGWLFGIAVSYMLYSSLIPLYSW